MKRILFLLISFLFLSTEMIPQVIEGPLDNTGQDFLPIRIPHLGSFKELVIPIGFYGDTNVAWSALDTSSIYPLPGIFPNGTLLQDSIITLGHPMPFDYWFEPALDYYFDKTSNGKHTVDFEFIKKANGLPYTTYDPFSYWGGTSDSNIIWNNWKAMANQVVEQIYLDNPTAFDGVEALHFVFKVGSTTKRQFSLDFGGTIGDVDLTGQYGNYFTGPATINWKADAIIHERGHLLGLPDRGTKLLGSPDKYTATYGYDLMYNRGSLMAEHSLFAQKPIISDDLIWLGWIDNDEILNLTINNYQNYNDIVLTDINDTLTQLGCF